MRQRERGKLTCRERIDLLLDDGTFQRLAVLLVSSRWGSRISAFTPANSVGGWGTVGALKNRLRRRLHVRGGHSDGAIGAKSTYLDRLAIELCIPSVRLLDGSSGGGSVAAMIPEQKKSGENNSKESQGAIKAGRPRIVGVAVLTCPVISELDVHRAVGIVPVVNLLLGSVVDWRGKSSAGPLVMVRDISQLFVAGPRWLVTYGIRCD